MFIGLLLASWDVRLHALGAGLHNARPLRCTSSRMCNTRHDSAYPYIRRHVEVLDALGNGVSDIGFVPLVPSILAIAYDRLSASHTSHIPMPIAAAVALGIAPRRLYQGMHVLPARGRAERIKRTGRGSSVANLCVLLFLFLHRGGLGDTSRPYTEQASTPCVVGVSLS